MERREIFERVVQSADRFGPGNAQQLKFFGSVLNKCRPEEVFYGLLAVFVDCPVDDKYFQRQELAGRLLEKMKPSIHFDLEAALRAVLPNYNPSIEQLPQHFARVHGIGAVLKAIDELAKEALADREKKCLQTMRWWLTGEAKGSHGAGSA